MAIAPTKGKPLDWDDWKVIILNWEDQAVLPEVPLPKYIPQKQVQWTEVMKHVFGRNIISFFKP